MGLLLKYHDVYTILEMISLDEVKSPPEQWINTTAIRSDEKIEYREKKAFGNRHAVFEKGALWGNIHHDQFNATDFPVGTVKHFSNYVEEKTSVPQDVVTGIIAGCVAGVSIYAGYKTAKWLSNKI